MLEIKGLQVSYGKIDVLRGIDLRVGEREILSILGPNGSGKSTTLKAIAGVVRQKEGSIQYLGGDISRSSIAERVKRGLVLVPQGRRLFGPLTVEENLLLGAFTRSDRAAIKSDLESWLEVFPSLRRLRHRHAEDLSGGEQQMVAVVRGLMAQPKILLFDEPSLGVSPGLINQLAKTLETLREQHGMTVILVEQNVSLALQVADRVVVLAGGRIVLEDVPANLLDRKRLDEVYFAANRQRRKQGECQVH